ncbi:DUF4864 domain-containing protein [Pseudoroseicyclus aestuarii]|uniref:Uncharacterized protein DUF4864 n=1 Tax=Pseudoroseicyclus aestuarii TaxID=1795041 RepID=A0A318SUX8_9RHOB|nr:DUF4864 domain-containing protein [Pseudoroseicyclus aestuarii]PYE84086.1 uncharacterized protein DUF4864 [Pseudoroseicyclus aestuarii]
MRRILIALTILLLPLGAARAQEDGPRGVISGQLQAFNDGDIARAWGFASEGIRGLFGTQRNFGTMVQRGYPMVWNNEGARFAGTREAEGALYQRVLVEDAQGRLHLLEYRMIETPEGWRIDGVALLPAPDLAV